jgi:hypothetical protein
MKSHSLDRDRFRMDTLTTRAFRNQNSDVLRLALGNELFFIRDLDFLHL